MDVDPLEPGALPDSVLHERARLAARDEKRATLVLLLYLREVERRRLYAARGYSSLWEYVFKCLGYSEAGASERVGAMRLLRVPGVREKIESGQLTYTLAAKLARFFRSEEKTRTIPAEEKIKIIEKVSGKPSREADEILLGLSGRPGKTRPRERERQIAVPKPSSACEQTGLPQVRRGERDASPVRPETEGFRPEPCRDLAQVDDPPSATGEREIFTMVNLALDAEIRGMVERYREVHGRAEVREILRVTLRSYLDRGRPRGPGGDVALRAPELGARAIGEPKASHSPRFADAASVEAASFADDTPPVSSPASGPPDDMDRLNREALASVSQEARPHGQSRYIPVSVRRAVMERSGGRCEFMDSVTGRRCESRTRLEVDPVVPVALGGDDDAG